MDTEEIDTAAAEARARRAAQRIGLVARKSRWRRDTIDNLGGFMLVNSYNNVAVCGARFDLSTADVIEYCSPRKQGKG